MMHTIVLERTGNGFSAYVEELPGCVAAAETEEETYALIHEAIHLHRDLDASQFNVIFDMKSIGEFIQTSSNCAEVHGERNTPFFPAVYSGDLIGV
jgi:predicted RNase H-like HicB family nuclease